MQTRIVFDGQEYSGPDQMPEDVRTAYQETLAQLSADTDRSGVPDLLEGRGNILGIQPSSFTVNGRTIGDLPRPVIPAPGVCHPSGSRRSGNTRNTIHDSRTERTRSKSSGLRHEHPGHPPPGTLCFPRWGLIVLGVGVIMHMDASSRSAGGTFYIKFGILVALAWLVSIFVNLAWRRKR